MAPKFWDVLSESKRIIKTNPHHYLTLSLLFLLPLSFSSLLFQNLFQHLQQQQPPPNPTTIIFVSLIFFIFSTIFTFSAIATITYSVFHTFFNRPIKLHEALKSISTSFFPLLATATVSFAIYFTIFFFSTLVLALVFYVAMQRGIETTVYGSLVMLCSVVLMLVLLPLIAYMNVRWSLAQVIVVLESRLGFEPLRRSASLVKGMKRVVLNSFFFFGLLQGIFVFIIYHHSINWLLILVISPFQSMVALFQITVNTVLYIYCKDNNGEFPEEEIEKEKDQGAGLSLLA